MNYFLLFAILSTAFVEQTVITIVRITTTYRAVELDLSVIWLGIITAVYAVLPIGIGVPIGRFIDRGYDAATTWIGGGLLIVGSAGFVLLPSLPGILLSTALLGTAHLLFVVSQQVQCTRCGTGPGAMERAIGSYMVANAAGQGVGPYIVGLAGGSASVPPTHFLFAVGVGGAVLTAGCALLTRSTGAHKLPPERARPPLRELLFAPGLTAIIVVSIVTVVAQDLIVVYLPLLGADRGMTVDAVGTLLVTRAVASMLSRLSFARLHVVFGRIRLTLVSTFVGAVAYALIALPLPLPLMYSAIAVAGFALSIAITSSIAGVLAIASGGAIGTANSLRTMASRIGQFIIPILASFIAAAVGTGSIFVIIGISLAASGAAVRFDSKRAGARPRR
ncbi:MAG TPA: MFS transporter [Xanthobacteraceae bacterium]|jgi:MFS family permease|nr:MFS transporter [Xanthobacteraceae bacterium]